MIPNPSSSKCVYFCSAVDKDLEAKAMLWGAQSHLHFGGTALLQVHMGIHHMLVVIHYQHQNELASCLKLETF